MVVIYMEDIIMLCKNHKNNKWYIHNDTHVSETNIENVMSTSPYCLFYIKN